MSMEETTTVYKRNSTCTFNETKNEERGAEYFGTTF